MARNKEVDAKTPEQRIAALSETANALSRRGIAKSAADFATEAIRNAILLVYQLDTDGELANVDLVTNRILPPMPWGQGAYKTWGVRSSEIKILRRIMQLRALDGGPFLYADFGRSWVLNLSVYPTIDSALAWLDANPVTVNEWRTGAEDYRYARRR